MTFDGWTDVVLDFFEGLEADKAPYKTQVGATLAGHGYLQLSANGLAAASGMCAFAPDQLARSGRG